MAASRACRRCSTTPSASATSSPVPLALFLLAGAVVVLLSFALVAPDGGRRPVRGGAAQAASSSPGHRIWSTVSVVLLWLLVLVGLVGTEEVAGTCSRPCSGSHLGGVAAGGRAWPATSPRRLNPFGAIAQAADRHRTRRAVLGTRRRCPGRALGSVGVRRALLPRAGRAELVVNARPRPCRRWSPSGLLLYAVVCAAGGLVFGPTAFTTRAEVFTVMFASLGPARAAPPRRPGPAGFGGGLEVPFQPTAGRPAGRAAAAGLGGLRRPAVDPALVAPVRALPGAVAPGPAPRVFAVATLVLFALVMFIGFGPFAQASSRAGGHAHPAWCRR